MNSTTATTPNFEQSVAAFDAFDWRKPDPIVQAVWDIKAKINQECDYSIDKIFDMARASRLSRMSTQG